MSVINEEYGHRFVFWLGLIKRLEKIPNMTLRADLVKEFARREGPVPKELEEKLQQVIAFSPN